MADAGFWLVQDIPYNNSQQNNRDSSAVKSEYNCLRFPHGSGMKTPVVTHKETRSNRKSALQSNKPNSEHQSNLVPMAISKKKATKVAEIVTRAQKKAEEVNNSEGYNFGHWLSFTLLLIIGFITLRHWGQLLFTYLRWYLPRFQQQPEQWRHQRQLNQTCIVKRIPKKTISAPMYY